MPNHNIKGTALDITPELREYIEKRLAHIQKFTQDDSSTHVDIELEYKEGGRSKQYRAEFTLAMRGGVRRAEAWGESMHAAVDVAIAELARELGTQKKRRLHVLRSSAAKVKEYLRGWRKAI